MLEFQTININLMNIYFPFEGQARELNARIHFCVEAAKRGHNAYFGQKSNLIPLIKKLQPGIFFHKSVQLRKKGQIAELKDLGHFNVAIDEEGLMRIDDEVYFGYRLSKDCLDLLDIFFSWGDEHTDSIIKYYPDLSKKVISAGNSRIDILKYFTKDNSGASYLRKKYGKFLLFASKFPRCNGLNYKNFRGYADAMKSNFKDMSKKLYKTLQKNVEWERENMIAYIEAIKECAIAFKDRKIVIRPHPTEDLTTWHKLVNDLKLDNIIIDSDGNSIIPWILAAEKIISHNCTTAVESAFLGVKTINYTPIQHELFEYKLPLIVSQTARNVEELKSFIENKNENYDIDKNEIQYYVKNFDNKTFCDYSMETIENIVNSDDFSRTNKSLNQYSLLIHKIFRNIKKTYSLFIGKGRKRRVYFTQKFRGFDLKQVKDTLDLFSSNDEVNIKEAWPGVFLLTKK